MSNESSAEIATVRRDWKTEHLAMYLESGGCKGHVMDLRDVGGEVVVCASKGGADQHPAWYLNVVASKEIGFQIATQAFRGSWCEPESAERAKVWAFMQGVFPAYTTYQASTAMRAGRCSALASPCIAASKSRRVFHQISMMQSKPG